MLDLLILRALHNPLPSRGSMRTSQGLGSRGRKRQFTEAYPTADPETSPLPPTKRSKLKTNGSRVPLVPNVSKLWLTRRALKEFDRRNQENPHSAQRAVPNTWVGHLSAAFKNPSNQLKRFARHGGPDL